MRQAGVVAAGGVYALRHHVERLAEDHANARRLAEGLAGCPGITLDPKGVVTNIVIFDVAAMGLDARTFAGRMEREHGVRFSVVGASLVRAVTHLDVSRAQVDEAIASVAKLLKVRLPGT